MKLLVTKPDEVPNESSGVQERLTTEGAIRTEILSTLGRPPDLYRVVVFPLWGNRYRVNVLTGPDASSVRIRHSYFVEMGDNRSIVSTIPRIARLYE